MIVEINDLTTPMLQALKAVSQDVAYEHMSKIGNAVRKNAKNSMARHRHNWLQRTRKTGRILSRKTSELSPYYDSSKTKELGMRTRQNGNVDSPDSMRNMISSFLMEKSGTLIVGGRNKAFTPVKRRDGEIVGTEKRQPTITKHTQSIVHKLDTGERNRHHGWGSVGSKDSMPSFKNAKYVGRHFMIKAFGESIPYMKQELTIGYEKTIGRAVNRVQIRLKPSKRVVV